MVPEADTTTVVGKLLNFYFTIFFQKQLNKYFEGKCRTEQHEALEPRAEDRFVSECEDDGVHYKTEQCNDVTDYCWCADRVTGLMIPKTILPRRLFERYAILCDRKPSMGYSWFYFYFLKLNCWFSFSKMPHAAFWCPSKWNIGFYSTELRWKRWFFPKAMHRLVLRLLVHRHCNRRPRWCIGKPCEWNSNLQTTTAKFEK